MQKGFIYFLLILLACKYINCSIKCQLGSILVENRCEDCILPMMVSSNNQECVHVCNANEFIESQQNYKRCLKQCPKFLGPDGKNCQDTCPIEDLTQDKSICLNKKEECRNGVISQNEKQCLKKCNDNEQTIPKNGYYQCECSASTHKQVTINSITLCLQRCKDDEIYDLNFDCIHHSQCSGFDHLDQQKCNRQCENIILGKYDNQLQKECSYYCAQQRYQNQFLNKCLDRCPSNQGEKECLSQKLECQKKISSNENFCVLQCEENEFINPDTYVQSEGKTMKCESECKYPQYEQNGKKNCTNNETCQFLNQIKCDEDTTTPGTSAIPILKMSILGVIIFALFV